MKLQPNTKNDFNKNKIQKFKNCVLIIQPGLQDENENMNENENEFVYSTTLDSLLVINNRASDNKLTRKKP